MRLHTHSLLQLAAHGLTVSLLPHINITTPPIPYRYHFLSLLPTDLISSPPERISRVFVLTNRLD